jgi:tetratricopeptide (TPR) repeat protein
MRRTKYTVVLIALMFCASTACASMEGAWIIDTGSPAASTDILAFDATTQVLWAALNDEDQEHEYSPDEEYEKASEAYNHARDLLDDEEWQKAADAFEQVAKMQSRYDAASLYWQAYADNKLAHYSHALRVLEKLNSESYAGSRWRKDGRALELQIRQALGQDVEPEAESDEELKLMVIESLIHTNIERAVPMLKKILDGPNSPEMKKKALFVLSQSSSPEAQQIMADYARGESDPELQSEAIEHIAMFGGKASRALLKDIYGTSTDRDVREKILGSFLLTGDSDYLLDVARTESDPELRIKAIDVLGMMSRPDALYELYQVERDRDVREEIIESFMVSGSDDRLFDIAKSDTDPELRMKAIEQLGLIGKHSRLHELYRTERDAEIRAKIIDAIWLRGDAEFLIEVARTDSDRDMRLEAIEKLGLMGSKTTGQAMASLYASETDSEIREQLLDSFFLQGNVDALIDVAKTEKDRDLRMEAIEKLSLMSSDKATDFLLELLDE